MSEEDNKRTPGLKSATVAVYSLKGGVGKTTFTVNLAWASANISRRRTLVWDLDPRAASTWLLTGGGKANGGTDAQAVFAREIDPRKLSRPSRLEGVDLIAADTSLRGLDRLLYDLGRRKRLAKLIEGLSADYDRIILDCPPGLTEISEQVLQAADVVVAPVIPSPLSQRALGEVARFLIQKKGRHPPILPAFSMVDRRRSLHARALEEEPNWPVIPMASAIEQMSARRQAVGEFARASRAAKSFAELWTAVEKKLHG